MVAYYNAEGGDTLNTFQFQPQSMSFEVIDRKVFAEVLYPRDIYDLIDFLVRECVKREVKMRVCKNCLRYFAVTGKTSTEYCGRVCDSKGRTCREMGAINTWTQRKQGDEVFKEYRREYKKRFARINAGRLTKSAFYAWSEEARRKKEDCLWFILHPLLKEGQAQKAECREGDAAKNVYPVKEQQIDCIPHGHPCKEHRIRLNRSNCLHDRRDTEGTDPA